MQAPIGRQELGVLKGRRPSCQEHDVGKGEWCRVRSWREDGDKGQRVREGKRGHGKK